MVAVGVGPGDAFACEGQGQAAWRGTRGSWQVRVEKWRVALSAFGGTVRGLKSPDALRPLLPPWQGNVRSF
jgi:hypothetical protein